MNDRERYPWIYDLLFLLVFALAGYLRLTGVDWGEGQHQHPDENTFSGVLYGMQAQKCADATLPLTACPAEQKQWIRIAEYFNSKTSTLNPYNFGYGSFVYGDLPMIMIRVAADISNSTDARLFGRQASAFADLFAILFLYLIVSNLYNRRTALLASLFSALAVMQIQQSHFFTIDLFVNTFSLLAIYFAVKILDAKYSADDIQESEVESQDSEMENGETEIEIREAELVHNESLDVPNESRITSSREAFRRDNSRFTNYALRFLRNP